MNCADCRTEDADCLTADRVRVCSDCLYERVIKERDEARAQIEQMNLEAADVRRLARSMAEDAFRKRDEAQERAEERNDEANRLQRYLNMAAKERDAARSELAFIAAEYEKANASDLTRDALAMQNAALKADVERVMHERDEAESELALHKSERLRLRAEDLRLRREVERLKGVLDSIRAARSLLGQLRDDVSDHACDELLSLLSDEPLDVDGNLYLTPSQAAYQRGAEAMREAAARWVADFCASGKAVAIRALPLPEDR